MLRMPIELAAKIKYSKTFCLLDILRHVVVVLKNTTGGEVSCFPSKSCVYVCVCVCARPIACVYIKLSNKRQQASCASGLALLVSFCRRVLTLSS